MTHFLLSKRSKTPWYIVTLLFVLEFIIWIGALFVIKTFLFQPFRIYGSSMMDTLQSKDIVFISKLAYGDRFGDEVDASDVIVLKPPLTRVHTHDVILNSHGKNFIHLQKKVSQKNNTSVQILSDNADYQITSHNSSFFVIDFVKSLFHITFYDRVLITGNPGDTVQVKITETADFYIKRIVGIPGDTIRLQDGYVYRNDMRLTEKYLAERNISSTFSREPIRLTVPANHYFVLGDNRENSIDSRSCFGSCRFDNATHFVSKEDIVGKATFVFWPPSRFGTILYPS
jgi:signal peptidase I